MSPSYPEWQKPYHDELLELNPQKLVQRVSEAERVILSRLQGIRFSSGIVTAKKRLISLASDGTDGYRIWDSTRQEFNDLLDDCT